MLKRNFLLGGLLGLATTSALAGGQFNLQLNGDAVKAEVEGSLSKNSLYSAAYHYSEDEGSIVTLGARATHSNNHGDFGLGAKYVGIDPKGKALDNAHVLAIGGDYSLGLAPALVIRIAAYGAPSVLTSGDLDSYYDLDVSLAYKLMPNADVMLGYKAARLDFEGFDKNFYFDKSLYAGVSFKF